MALELYVGTLTDYFRAALVNAARSAGADPSSVPARDTFALRVEAWRDYVNDGLVSHGHLPAPLSWSEATGDAYTHLLGTDPMRALKLMLVHGASDAGCAGDTPDLLPADPERHPRWIAAAADDFTATGFDQVLVPELWLPGDFDFTFDCPYPDGHEAQAGSLGALRFQLEAIARSRLPGSREVRRGWAAAPPPDGTRHLVALARFAFGAIDAACTEAERRQQPMLLHW